MYKRLLTILTMLLLLVPSVDGATKRFTLVIDAGHGGKDTGSKGKQTKEKTLTLRYALAFGRIIEQNCPDVKVIYTRKEDRFLELWQRAEIANKAKADLFVSVHINALPGGRIARGYQTYTLGRSRRDGNKRGFIENLEVAKRENAVILYEKDYQQHYEGFDPNSPESNIIFELMQDKNMENSIQLAKYMQRYICSATGRQDKGVHQDNLAVLRLSSMPACLMELGFISTPDEEQYLDTDRAVNAYARGFYNAIVAYKNKVAPGIKVPYKPAPVEPVLTEKPEKAEKTEKAEKSEKAEKPDKQEKEETQEKPAVAETPVVTGAADGQNQAAAASAAESSAPVFKVQLLASAVRLKAKSPQLKGVADTDYYQEGKLFKYTVGASANYQEIYQLRKSLLDRFPQAFIVAFKDGAKVNVNEAISEWRKNRKTKK